MQIKTAFIGGAKGKWRVTSMKSVIGPGLDPVSHLEVLQRSSAAPDQSGAWVIEGQNSNIRYAIRAEVTALRAKQEPLGRPEARLAAMIPIKKSDAWWALAQDERRAIFEETSHHTAIGMNYLPAVSRQLYHSRDLGEPFDFITWFEYAPPHAAEFEDLVARLRSSQEWQFVEREIDIRLEAGT